MAVRRILLGLISMYTVVTSNYLYVEEIVPDRALTLNYIYINDQKYTWHQAVEVCENVNGSLLNIDSWEQYTILRRLTNSSDYWNELDSEAWVGLTNSAWGHRWLDCSPLNFSSFVHFKDSGSVSFHSDQQCYITKSNLDFAVEQKACDDKKGAICVQRIKDNTCPLSPLLSLRLLSVESFSRTDCKSACESDVNCYAVFSHSDSHCLMMGTSKPSTPEQEAHLDIRKCVKGEIKSSTDFPVSLTAVSDKTVHLACNSTENVVIMATPSFAYMQTSCAITMTEYVTVNLTMTNYVTENLTLTVGVPAPSPSPSPCSEMTTYINITNSEYVQEAVENISKALYLDKTTTSAYVRSKTSALDERPSAATVGYIGIACLVTPFAFILLLDLHSVYLKMRKTRHSFVCSEDGSD